MVNSSLTRQQNNYNATLQHDKVTGSTSESVFLDDKVYNVHVLCTSAGCLYVCCVYKLETIVVHFTSIVL